MKLKNLQKKIVFQKKTKLEETVLVFYFHEGKRLSFYSGTLVRSSSTNKEIGKFLVFRSNDRSLQFFFYKAPSLLSYQGVAEWFKASHC
jgi:hypothetical protein